MTEDIRAEEIEFDPAAQVAEIAALLREGGWDGDNVVAGVKGLIAYLELLRLSPQRLTRDGTAEQWLALQQSEASNG